jgi:uncharacterized SAM-binding protein YcdF (DUF218 family)
LYIYLSKLLPLMVLPIGIVIELSLVALLFLLLGKRKASAALLLYRAGKGEVLIVAGGNQPWSPSEQPEAESIQTLLLEWGVPVSAIVLEGTSRNTRENAVNSRALLEKLDCNRPLLVTSAAHMVRSVAAFEKLGVDVFAVSADVRVIRKSTLAVLDFLPDAVALLMTTDAMREWLGRRVYEWRGWN